MKNLLALWALLALLIAPAGAASPDPRILVDQGPSSGLVAQEAWGRSQGEEPARFRA